MIFLITILACFLIGGGASAIVIGAGMIVLERGWAMVISGSVIATGGFILLGIAMLLRELRRLPDQLVEFLPGAFPAQGFNANVDPFLSKSPPSSESLPSPNFDMPAEKIVASDSTPTIPASAPVKEKVVEPAVPTAGVAAPEFLLRRDITQIEPPPLSAAPPTKKTGEPNFDVLSANDKNARSGLKIQISLHGETVTDSPSTISAPMPVVPAAPAEKSSGSFWSRFGKAGRHDVAPPSGPTAADLARTRLSLADTPIEKELETEPPTLSATPEVIVPSKSIKSPKIDVSSEGSENLSAVKTLTDKAIKAEPAPILPVDTQITSEQTTKAQKPLTPPAKSEEPTSDQDKIATPSADSTPNVSAEEVQRQVVGSYRAGKNVYVMYDDGTIEAETPQGIFRFESLDGLKSYIASGEDPALTGTRVDRAPTKSEIS